MNYEPVLIAKRSTGFLEFFMFTDLLSCDLSFFEELFLVVGGLYKNVMIPMGIVMLLLICLFFAIAVKIIINYILNFAGTPYQWGAGTESKVSFSYILSIRSL